MRALVSAASQQGATAGIAEAIARRLRRAGVDVDVTAPDEVADVDDIDAFVFGSAIYTGHWLEPATDLVRRVAPSLAGRPTWLFSSGPVGDPGRKLVQKMTADPIELEELQALTSARGHRLFAGKLSGESLTLLRRVPLIVFRGLEGDWRDWEEIDRWAGGIAAELLTGDRAPTDPARA